MVRGSDRHVSWMNLGQVFGACPTRRRAAQTQDRNTTLPSWERVAWDPKDLDRWEKMDGCMLSYYTSSWNAVEKINIQHQKLQYFVLNKKNLFSGSSAQRICALCELKVRGHLQLVMLALAGASQLSSGGSSLSSPDARPRQRSTSHTSGWYREK